MWQELTGDSSCRCLQACPWESVQLPRGWTQGPAISWTSCPISPITSSTPWLDKRGLNTLAQLAWGTKRPQSPEVSKHTICAGEVCNPGACQRRVVKMMNGCHISKALADLGSHWQAHHSQRVSQLITSNFIFLVNTSWQIGHYLFILQQWALLLFWWSLENFSSFLLLHFQSEMKRSEREH